MGRPRIAILKYGVGNIYSVYSGLERAGAEPMVVDRLKGDFDALVLPGVGAFRPAMERLRPQKGLLLDMLDSGGIILGICLGMQLFYEWSDEWGGLEGLGLLHGRIERIPVRKLPHIGWSRIQRSRRCRLLKDVKPDSYFYFVHSYALLEGRPETCAYTEYGGTMFASIVEAHPIYGTQFHPERSDGPGLKVLKNFVSMMEK